MNEPSLSADNNKNTVQTWSMARGRTDWVVLGLCTDDSLQGDPSTSTSPRRFVLLVPSSPLPSNLPLFACDASMVGRLPAWRINKRTRSAHTRPPREFNDTNYPNENRVEPLQSCTDDRRSKSPVECAITAANVL